MTDTATIWQRIVGYLRARPETRAAQVARALDLPAAAVRRVLRELEEDGLAVRRNGTLWALAEEDAPPACVVIDLAAWRAARDRAAAGGGRGGGGPRAA